MCMCDYAYVCAYASVCLCLVVHVNKSAYVSLCVSVCVSVCACW